MANNQEKEHWHLDKRVSVSHIAITFSVVAGAVTWGSAIDQKIDANRSAIEHQKEIRAIENQELRRTLDDVKEKGDQIDEKIDRIINHMLKSNRTGS